MQPPNRLQLEPESRAEDVIILRVLRFVDAGWTIREIAWLFELDPLWVRDVNRGVRAATGD